MYFKLLICNTKRSIVNYLLYITTMTILLSIMEVSNCIAIVGKQVGFQTISLPILITLLLVILVGYIDSFILKQRAKESNLQSRASLIIIYFLYRQINCLLLYLA